MHFVIKNKIYPFTPRISAILANMAEAGAFTATYLPSTSKRPCCYCLINNDELNNMTLSNMFYEHHKICKKLSTQTRHVNFPYMPNSIFFGNLTILTYMKPLYQIGCICLTLELQ